MLAHQVETSRRPTLKSVFTVALGIVASFVFTVFVEMLTMASTAPLTVLHIHPELPAITVLVGMLVGFIERNKTPMIAILSLVPWSITMILGVNSSHSSASRWMISIAVVTIYAGTGIGAAILTAKIGRRFSQAKASA